MRKKTRNSSGNSVGLPEFIFPLFWEYDPENIDIELHANIIMERVMERGPWISMVWLRKTYSRNQLVSYLEKRGNRILSPRELNYWALMSGVSADKRKNWLRNASERHDVWRDRHSR